MFSTPAAMFYYQSEASAQYRAPLQSAAWNTLTVHLRRVSTLTSGSTNTNT